MGQAPGARSLAGHLVPPSESALLWALSAGRAVVTDWIGPASAWAVRAGGRVCSGSPGRGPDGTPRPVVLECRGQIAHAV